MAAYGGNAIFGYAVKMRTVTNPTAQQLNAFFGLDGVQSLFGGMRGRYTEVDGVLRGGSLAELNAAIGQFESYFDGISRVLVDNFGNAWPQVLMDRFEPGPKIIRHADDSRWLQYKCGFKHLI